MWLFKNLFAPSSPSGPREKGSASDAERVALPASATEFTGEIAADANVLAEAGRHAEALAMVDRALESAPVDVRLLFARASTLFSAGRYAEARKVLLIARTSGLRSLELHLRLGWACLWSGRIDEAAESMRAAIGSAHTDWSGHFGLATARLAQGSTEASAAAFRRALELKPDDPFCLSNLVGCEIDLGHLKEAERLARHAIDLTPSSADAWTNLGVVLDNTDRYDEAIAAHCRAVEFQVPSDSPEDYYNYVVCLLHAGRTRAALEVLEIRLAAMPGARAQSQYGLALLTAGRLLEGFAQYEFRWAKEPLLSARAKFVKPLWRGQPLTGRTVLLRSEQGAGDFIQFIRYGALVKSLGAKVLLELREEMRTLASGLPWVDAILAPAAPYPPFDFHIPLLSLPHVAATDLESIPAQVPYLKVPGDYAAKWAGRINSQQTFNVGIVWAGSRDHARDRYRSLSLAQIAPLFEIEGIGWYSLQKGAPVEDEGSTLPDHVVDLAPNLSDFSDTAAVIDMLDLVIGVDTSVIHLAGALGKPVWTLVAKPADWRWLEDRVDSPWYPTMTLFRQRTQGEWNDVVVRVTQALRIELECAAARSRGMPRAAGDVQITPASRQFASAPTSARAEIAQVTETRFGIMMYLPDDVPASASIGCYGEYLQPQLDVLERFIAPGMTVVEAGAGIGAHSLFLASSLGHEGTLLLYEGDRRLRRVLTENLEANHIVNATVMRRTLGVADGSDTLDELHLTELHLLKVSAPSLAIGILRGAEETMWRHRPRLFLAAADFAELERIASVGKDFGYLCWSIRTPIYRSDNFNLRVDDVLEGANAFALLALPEELAGTKIETEYLTSMNELGLKL